jgi:hypothetical protein
LYFGKFRSLVPKVSEPMNSLACGVLWGLTEDTAPNYDDSTFDSGFQGLRLIPSITRFVH